MTALANRANLAVPVNNANAEIGLLAMWDALNEATEKPEIDIASASTCNIGAMAPTKLRITGTTTITSFGTVYRGPILIRMADALTITYNATTLVCPGNANLVTATGDVLMAFPKTTTSGTSNGWQVVLLSRASASAARAAIGAAGSTGNETIAGIKTFSDAITPSSTSGIVGTTTSNDANAGSIGECIESEIASGSAVSLSTDVPKTVTSISLTAGDWDVDAFGGLIFPASTSFTGFECSISTVDNTLAKWSTTHRTSALAPGAGSAITYPVRTKRIKISSTTTVYLVVNAIFTVSTLAAFGAITARRRR